MKKMTWIFLLAFVSLRCVAPESLQAVIIRPALLQKVYSDEEKLQAIIFYESGTSSAGAYNKNEPQAVGLLQEWPILVRDVNRILGYAKYTYEDRLNNKKAIEMFWIYQNYYNPTHNFEKMCRMWCGGPEGANRACTLNYYQNVLKILYSN